MKKCRRFLAMLLALSMALSVLPAAMAAEPFAKTVTWTEGQFKDLVESEWYYDTVRSTCELGLMKGDAAGTFRPNGSVTLAETVTVAARIHARAVHGSENFMQGTPWYRVYVDYALANGILDWELEDYSRPATRLEFARILANALPAEDLTEINTVLYGAIPDVADDEAVYTLYRAGVLTGNDEIGTFAPNSSIKRSEVAAIASRMALPVLRKTLDWAAAVEDAPTYFEPEQGDDSEGELGDTETPVFSENANDPAQPFDIENPDAFASGAVQYSGEHILVKLATDRGLTDGLKKAGITAMEKIMELESGVWYKAYTDGDVTAVMEAVRALKEVKVAEYDYAYETDVIIDSKPEDVDEDMKSNDKHKEQWYLCSCGIQKGLGHLKHHHHHGPKPDDTDNGDENVGIAGDGIVVAVIDTGVDYTHEDLKDNIWVNRGEIPDNGVDDDKNGYIDDYYGYNAVAGKGSAMDDNGHGTHVAGIIAAADNEMGVVGIAYNAKIMPIKAGMASGYFNQSDIAEAVMYAAQNGADVINMSFGGSASSIAVTDALEWAYTYCVLVASAGNDGLPNEAPLGYVGPVLPNYPAALSYVLGVMSVDENGVESAFTNWDAYAYNSVEYELYAPGEKMLSTIPGNRYASWSGTSMAAPVVSAMAALVRAEFYDRNTYPTKFIYGQLSGTGETTAACIDPGIHKKHNLPKIVDLYNAMTVLPKPEVGVSDYVIFDTVGLNGSERNNGDGVIDAGETIAIGFTLRNRWGKTGETTVTVDATNHKSGIADPYITIVNPTVSYGSVGTYSTANAGWLKDEDGVIIGMENPIYLEISPDCPNDYIFTIHVNHASTNGLDASDETVYRPDPDEIPKFNLDVRRGRILPNLIEEDMTLTAEDVWIIPNATLIKKGATVTVEPGTQIQFWSDDPNDAYAESAIAYLQVEGAFLCQGTEEAPIELYPSERMSQYRVEIRDASGTVRMYHTKVVNPYIEGADYAEHCEFTQNHRNQGIYYRSFSSGKISVISYYGGRVEAAVLRNCAFDRVGSGPTDSYKFGSSGAHDGCIFVDSVIAFNGTYENCLFYGNNNYLGEKTGAASNIHITDAAWTREFCDKVVSGDRTYLAVRFLGSFRWMQRFAEYLGGSLVVIETPEELEFLRGADLRYSSYKVRYLKLGMILDEGGSPVWVDGSPVGEFFPMEELRTAPTMTSTAAWIRDASSPLNEDIYLIELPTTTVDEIQLSQYEVILDLEEGSVYQIAAETTPSPTTADQLIYESLDSTVAVVSDSGLVTPVGVGTTTIRVYAPDKAVFNTLTVTVQEPVALEAIEVGEDVTLNKGETLQLKPVLTPANTTKTLLTYASSNVEAAMVSDSGLVTAVAHGSAVITVKNPQTGLSDTLTVTVRVPVTSVAAEENIVLVNLTAEDTVDALGVTVLPADATDKTLLWESSNPEIIDVDETGKLIKGKTGTAVLRATAKGTDIYTEVAVCVSEESPEVTVVQMERIVDANGVYYAACLSDGTLWYWGNEISVPKKLPFENAAAFEYICSSRYGWNYGDMAILDKNGVLRLYLMRQLSDTPVEDNAPLGGSPLENVAQIDSFELSAYVRTHDGAVYAWGNNSGGQLGDGSKMRRYTAIQLNVAGITDMAATSELLWLLDKHGNVTSCGRGNTLWQTVATGVMDIYPAGPDNAGCCLIFTDEASVCESINSQFTSQFTVSRRGDVDYLTNYHYVSLQNGVPYVRVSRNDPGNTYGQAGIGDSKLTYDLMRVRKLTNVTRVFLFEQNIFWQTADGRFYASGRNDTNQLGNLHEGHANVPTQMFFGMSQETSAPSLESQIYADGALTLDFDQAMHAGTDYGYIFVTDSTGTRIPIQKTVRLDKVIFSLFSGFVEGETYTLTIPQNSLTSLFGVSAAAMELTVAVEQEIGEKTELEQGGGLSAGESFGEFSRMPAELSVLLSEDAVVHETQVNPDVTRMEWNADTFAAKWKEYREDGINPQFYGNAIVNRLDREDKVESEWLRLVAPESSAHEKISVTGNWWGTASEALIQKQIVDFDDYMQYADLNHAGFLTEAPETVWPFAVKAGIIDKAGNEVTVVGNEKLTFFVEFNRDMDTSIPLDVRFGSAYPYADYAVEGSWVSARRWEGTTTLTTLIEGGYQYWSIDNGRAADDTALKLYKDWGRFPFEIDTTEAQAMILQGEATATGVRLTWTQDDFDTLAGYNVYRADEDVDAYYQRLNSSILPVGEETFFDTTVEPGKVYYYVFKVVKTDLSESGASGKIMILSKDTMAPDLYHTPVYHGYAGSNLVVSAVATDNLQLQSVLLHYRAVGSEEWKRVEMTAFGDRYSAVIGGNDVTVAGIEYYVTAFDGVGTTSRGSAEAPYTITVQAPLDLSAKGDVDGDGRVTILDALLVLQGKNGRITLEADEFDRADLDGNGVLSAAEALKILRYANGEIGSLQ